MSYKKLYLLIPTYNSYSRLFACLSSLDASMPNRGISMEVIVYDQSTINYGNLVEEFIDKLGFIVHYHKDSDNDCNVRARLFKYAEDIMDKYYENYFFWMDDDFLFSKNPQKDFVDTMEMMNNSDVGIVRFSSAKDQFNRKFTDEDDIIYTGKGLMFKYFDGISSVLSDASKMIYFDDMIAVLNSMIISDCKYMVKTNVSSIIHNAAYASTLNMSNINLSSYAHQSNWVHMNTICKETLKLNTHDWTTVSNDLLLNNIIMTSKRILELYNRR